MTDVRPIGGYFGLELAQIPSRDTTLGFHTIRSALLALLKVLVTEGSHRKLWFPFFICPSVAEVFDVFGDQIELIEYNVGQDLEPINVTPSDQDLFYSYNVFGLSGAVSRPGAIVDYAHSFFAEAALGQHTLYSARKFLGVPDGAFLRTHLQVVPGNPFRLDNDALYLLLRHDQGAEIGYSTFRSWEKRIFSGKVQGISNLSRKLLSSIEYEPIKRRRIKNFSIMHTSLRQFNDLTPHIEKALTTTSFIPFSYPFLISYGPELREFLISEKVFTPVLWAGMEQNEGLTDFERNLALNTVHIPIDQRYDLNDMKRILTVIAGAFG